MSAQAQAEAPRRQDYRSTSDPVGENFERFAAALAELARERTAAFLTMQAPGAVNEEDRTALAVVAGDEMVSAMKSALNLAPQGPLTPDLFNLVKDHGRLFATTIDALYPVEPEKEKVLAQLVRTFKTSLTHFSQG